MSRKFRIAYFVHSIRSDWNNGNAHFLRGLMRALKAQGHEVTIFEAEQEWSIANLRLEPQGESSLTQFVEIYSDLNIRTYANSSADLWRERLYGVEFVLLHEWNPPALARILLHLRDELDYKLLFHDTHHRASSSPQSFLEFGLEQFDGVLAFGEVLRSIYRDRFGVNNVWTFHEAADITAFHPVDGLPGGPQIVWIGNWGDDERSEEIARYLLEPAAALSPEFHTCIYGVRYPSDALASLHAHSVAYGGYLPNLAAPRVYAAARVTVHIPRQQYTHAMIGIPTIRVFEALACGIPLVSAPWTDSERLFRPCDFLMANSPADMLDKMSSLLRSPQLAAEQAARGRETVLARHTCAHRAQQLTAIFEELLA